MTPFVNQLLWLSLMWRKIRLGYNSLNLWYEPIHLVGLNAFTAYNQVVRGLAQAPLNDFRHNWNTQSKSDHRLFRFATNMIHSTGCRCPINEIGFSQGRWTFRDLRNKLFGSSNGPVIGLVLHHMREDLNSSSTILFFFLTFRMCS